MSSYIFVSIRTDEDVLMGSNGWGEYDEKDSVAAYGNAVEQAIIEAFPGAEVDVTTYGSRLSVETDIDAATDDAIASIVNQVWQSWEWLRK